MRFFLRDVNRSVVEAWRIEFLRAEDVDVSEGDIFDLKAGAIVSPANSFGFMDGGIDLVYMGRFGWEVQDRLQALIRKDHDGELPVGQAVVVPTFDQDIPYLVSAPTMRVPMDVSGTVNAYLAFRATIRAVQDFNRTTPWRIESILCPGLGTAVGKMPARQCARQMHLAYATSHLGHAWSPVSLGAAVEIHRSMT